MSKGVAGSYSNRETQRITLEFEVDDLELIEKLRAKIGAASRTEVLRRAVRLMDTTIQHQKDLRSKGVYLIP